MTGQDILKTIGKETCRRVYAALALDAEQIKAMTMYDIDYLTDKLVVALTQEAASDSHHETTALIDKVPVGLWDYLKNSLPTKYLWRPRLRPIFATTQIYNYTVNVTRIDK